MEKKESAPALCPRCGKALVTRRRAREVLHHCPHGCRYAIREVPVLERSDKR